MKLGDTIKLIPKTRHGKNRVREHGETTTVVHMRTASFCVETPDKDWRWIDNVNDLNFEWELI
tara:strand:- start:341 stop:529 length:189 start_codon:yes stop_codon:yes gene_type:complete